jgi:hypothetical protein
MPESKRKATKRAKRLGIPVSQVTRSHKGGYFIAPRGVYGHAKHIYAECRSAGGEKSTCAAVAHEHND